MAESCREKHPQPDNSAQPSATPPSVPTADHETIEKAISVLAPLIDPAKLDTLTGKRAATPRLRKACHWIEDGRRAGAGVNFIIERAQRRNGSFGTARAQLVAESLSRNRGILEELGCLDTQGMAKLRKGHAPTITEGPYPDALAARSAGPAGGPRTGVDRAMQS